MRFSFECTGKLGYKSKQKALKHCCFKAFCCEITQNLIQFPAIVMQYSYRFAMGAFGCKKGSVGATPSFRFAINYSIQSVCNHVNTPLESCSINRAHCLRDHMPFCVDEEGSRQRIGSIQATNYEMP